MAAISPTQLDTVAAFLETSRDYLEIEHTIRLHWPPVSTRTGCSEHAARSRAAKPARKSLARNAGQPRQTGA